MKEEGSSYTSPLILPPLSFFGSSPYRVGDFDMILDRIEHARENFQTQVLLIV